MGALTAALLAVSTTPASASGTYSGLPFVYGAGAWEDDWTNEGVVDVNTNRTSNVTCLWQTVLWADGYLSSTADIDGDFGTQTKTATAKWQSRYGLGADGSAGKNTWTEAGTRLIYLFPEGSEQYLTLYYPGEVDGFYVNRDANGNYQFWDGDGVKRTAGYNYRTCS
ncbi:peptidoglycan-binding protein [Streptomyces sp. NPDC085946]|uniref:peptidoglycan-binding protein n=1 Tax=Streptomyces sp. NPDC085946 TaxID=3365744 RepID=UPI0037D4644E